jgi:hypothetical protein
MRRALCEAAQSACRRGRPDRDYYAKAAERLGHNRACLSIARKLLKRSYHTLSDLGEGGTGTGLSFPVRAKPFVTQIAAAGSRQPPAPKLTWTALKDRAAATLPPAASPHQTSCRRPRANPRVVDRVRLGARAHTTRIIDRAHAPPADRSANLTPPEPVLDAGPLHN